VDQEVIDQLERMLVAEPVDSDYQELRIVAAQVESSQESPVDVHVSWSFRGHTGEFPRPFAPDEVQILGNPAYDETALAFAAWIRTELAEHISELIAAGEFDRD
jgi:hypothetical protein